VHAVINSYANDQATVFFLGPDSTVLAQVAVDSHGTATGPMQAGGFVVVGTTDTGDGTKLDVIADMQPGDEVTSGYTSNTTPPANLMAIEVPFDTGDADATEVEVFSPQCGSGELDKKTGAPDRAAGMISVDPTTCTGTVDVLLVSVDIGTPLRTASVQAQVTASGIDIATATFAVPADPTAFVFQHVPVETTRVVQFIGLGAGFGINGTIDAGGVTPANQQANVSLAMPLVAMPYQETVQLESPDALEDAIRWAPDATAVPRTVDLEPNLLPAFTAQPSWDATQHAITWTGTPRGRDGNWVQATIFTSTMARVVMRAPWTADKLVLPTLPMFEGVVFEPTAQPSFTLSVIGTAVPWSAFKRDENASPIAGASGTAAISSRDVEPGN
jgi:hypothetical protein